MVAVAILNGTGTAGQDDSLRFRAQLRLMQGMYRDRIGLLQRGTFLFARVDVYKDDRQLHALYLGPPQTQWNDPSAGLPWTQQILNPEKFLGGSAFSSLMQLNLENLPLRDSFQTESTKERLATGKLYASWVPGLNFYHFRSKEQNFAGTYAITAEAYMEFSFEGQTSFDDAIPFSFKSKEGVVQVEFAQVGYEVIGRFVEGW